jgi:hypothetical protein
MKNKMMMSLAVFGMTSCATVQLAPERLEGTQASMRSAEELGATSVPAAKLHLELAKDQAAQAKKMAADGDERAALVLARSEADAELALGLAREVTVHAAAVKASEDLKALRARGAP